MHSSESCPVKKTVKRKLEVIMLHLPENHLYEDSKYLIVLKCLKTEHFMSIVVYI